MENVKKCEHVLVYDRVVDNNIIFKCHTCGEEVYFDAHGVKIPSPQYSPRIGQTKGTFNYTSESTFEKVYSTDSDTIEDDISLNELRSLLSSIDFVYYYMNNIIYQHPCITTKMQKRVKKAMKHIMRASNMVEYKIDNLDKISKLLYDTETDE